jgi:hypothetical protein
VESGVSRGEIFGAASAEFRKYNFLFAKSVLLYYVEKGQKVEVEILIRPTVF